MDRREDCDWRALTRTSFLASGSRWRGRSQAAATWFVLYVGMGVTAVVDGLAWFGAKAGAVRCSASSTSARRSLA